MTVSESPKVATFRRFAGLSALRICLFKIMKNSTNSLMLFFSTANKKKFDISKILENVRYVTLGMQSDSQLAGLLRKSEENEESFSRCCCL